MKIELKEGMTFKVENGCVIIIEPEKVTKFKAGDCVIGKGNYFPSNAKMVEYVRDGCICKYDNDSNCCYFKYLRLATESEKKQLMSDLAKKGKRWDAQKMQIVDLEFIPKAGDVVTTVSPRGKTISIYKGGLVGYSGLFYFYALIHHDGGFHVGQQMGVGIGSEIRQSNREERCEFFSRLVKEGYKWNAKKLKLTKVEAKWEPKDGDFVAHTDKCGDTLISIFKQLRSDGTVANYACVGSSSWRNLLIDDWSSAEWADRPATESERATLLSALKKAGYKWNSKKLELTKVEAKWEPKDGEFIMAKDGTISILGKKDQGWNYKVLCRLFKSGRLDSDPYGIYTPGFITRKATESECQQILGALAKDGKTWNAELKRVEDAPVKTVELTMEQVCERLGMNVKIVKK